MRDSGWHLIALLDLKSFLVSDYKVTVENILIGRRIRFCFG